MRVGDRYRFEMFKYNIQKVQSNIVKANEQIASGKRINRPSDDSVIFSRVMEINAEKSLNSQFSRNLERLQTLGSMYESSFMGIHDLLSEAQEVAIAMADDTVDAASRKAAAQEIKDIIERLVLIGNTKLAGAYIFGGKSTTTSPFKLNSDYTVDLVTPYGAEEAISVYVSQGELMKAGFSARDVFYDRQKVLYQSPDNGFDGGVFLNGSYYGFVIDESNNTLIYNDGTGSADIEVRLDDGVYKGQELASKIQERLGSGYTVLYDSSARRFEITNNTGNTATFKWQISSIATTLGFQPVDLDVASGMSSKSDYDAFAKSFILKATTSGSTSGALDGRARYRYSLDGGITWSDEEIIVNYGKETLSDIVIDGSNNQFVVDETSGGGTIRSIALTEGRYTGASLASQIEDKLGTGYSVTYDSSNRKITITNNTGNQVALKWSSSFASEVLGYEAIDVTLNAGDSVTGDYAIADTALYVVDKSNSTLYEDGIAITLSSGRYTGEGLASQIESKLNAIQAGHTVTYDSATRRFTITNNTGSDITLNWSMEGATAGGLLGFDNKDLLIGNGTATTGAQEAGLSMGLVIDVGYKIDATNNVLYKNGTPLTLETGVYSGESLATELQTKLGADYQVSYNSATKGFSITNNTGSTTTLDWSNPRATARTILGFEAVDSVLNPGATDTSDFMTNSNDTIYRNGAAITIEQGTYTAEGLAKTIEEKLNSVQAGHTVTYDAATGKFSITNNTGVPVVFNWSRNSASDSSIGGLLGFDTIDSYITNGSSAISAFQTGMFIDGSNMINQTNNRLKATFEQSKDMIKEDTFNVEDMTIFQMLKGLMDSLENNNTHGIRVALDNLDYALDHTETNISYIGTYNSKIETLTTEKEDKGYTLEAVISEMVSTDITELATEYTILQTMYQALLYSIAKMQNLSLLNYL